MLIVIGKIECNSKLEAVRVVDTDSKQVKDVSYHSIRRKMIENNVKVKGFQKSQILDYSVGAVKDIIKKEKGNYNFSKLPALNGKGELINSTDARFLVIYGWSGFVEEKRYHCFNWKGETVLLNIEEFQKKVLANEINGAGIVVKNNKIVIAKELDVEIEV